MADPRQRRTALLALGLVGVLVCRLYAYRLFPICAEDAYITFHAALDPAWHKAATSPVWALLCSLGSPPDVARSLILLADCAAVWAAWRVLGAWGYLAFLALWVGPFFTGSAVSGLETHVVACAMLVANVWPGGYFMAAALRPDAAVFALCSSGRKWRWAATGAPTLLLIGLMYAGRALPQTLSSKAAVYGIHPGQWIYLHPLGFGWMTLALLPALWKPARSTLAAVAFLLTLVAIGLPCFWWYAVPPLAVLGFETCRKVKRWWHLSLAVAVVVGFWGSQTDTLSSRIDQELTLAKFGADLAKLHPKGTVLLEPAGIIPYMNHDLKVVDDVGLVDDWMAKRRARGPGWRTDAIARYRPEWIVMRVREYMLHYDPAINLGKYTPFYRGESSRPDGYKPVMATGVERKGALAMVDIRWSNMVALRRVPHFVLDTDTLRLNVRPSWQQ